MNTLLKDWQERKKLDCVRFTEEFEDVISQQESDILLAFLGLSSPYVIRKEYLHLAIKLNTYFSDKTVEEKAEIKKTFNVVVAEKCYQRSIPLGNEPLKELEIMLQLSSINQLQLSPFMLI